jgi:hypothetical protein
MNTDGSISDPVNYLFFAYPLLEALLNTRESPLLNNLTIMFVHLSKPRWPVIITVLLYNRGVLYTRKNENGLKCIHKRLRGCLDSLFCFLELHSAYAGGSTYDADPPTTILDGTSTFLAFIATAKGSVLLLPGKETSTIPSPEKLLSRPPVVV